MIAKFVGGIPYARHKRRRDIEAPKRWTDAVIRQTEDLPKVVNACLLKLTFCLPPDKFPADLPYGSDLDNLTKRTLDALQRTVFRASPCASQRSNLGKEKGASCLFRDVKSRRPCSAAPL